MKQRILRMYVLGFICLLAFILFAGVAYTQEPDPLLSDVRYWQQARNTLLQEQRANTLQISILQQRLKEIENGIRAIENKINELNAPKDIAPVAPTPEPEKHPG